MSFPGLLISLEVKQYEAGLMNPCSSVPMISRWLQGSVLGPELSKIFGNDFPTTLQFQCLIYADDLKWWLEASNLDDADRLLATLNILCDWSVFGDLRINCEKCCLFSNYAPEPLGTNHIGGSLPTNVSRSQDLGVIMSSELRITHDTVKKIATVNEMF